MKSWSVAGVSALGLFVGLGVGSAEAQQPTYRAPAQGYAPARAAASPTFRRVAYQDAPPNPAPSLPGDSAPPPPAVPGAAAAPGAFEATPPSTAAPTGAFTEPLSTNRDLSLPRSEREGGGGEPTEAAAAADAGAAPAKDPTKLLMNALGMEDSPVKIYGWLQNSYTGNTNGKPRNGLNFGVNPNFLANSWQGNQYYVVVENPLEQGDEVNFGFRIDSLFGNDWQFNHMHGLFDTAFTPNHFAGYDPAQFYAEVHIPGIISKGGTDIKGGRFYTILGYEVVPATGRPLLSVPYMFNYGQPFTHIGALATTHVTDRINWYNGTINGWDRFFNSTYKWGYIGGFTWTSEDTKATLAVSYTTGPNQYPSFLPANTPLFPTGYSPPGYMAGRRNPLYGGNYRTAITEVFTYKWSDTFTQVLETDQGYDPNIPGWGPGGSPKTAEWYSFGNWFLWQFWKTEEKGDVMTAVWRSEWFRDVGGIRTGTGQTDNYYEMTLGLIIKPVPYIWIRPEARYDWAQWGKPYSDGTRGDQFTLGVDAILLW